MDRPVYDVIIGNVSGAKVFNVEKTIQAVQTRQQTQHAKVDGKYKTL